MSGKKLDFESVKFRYAGVGYRFIGGAMALRMMRVAMIYRLECGRGYSGAAEGSDHAVEFGFYLAEQQLLKRGYIPSISGRFFQAVLPWPNFNDRQSILPWVRQTFPDTAFDVAKQYHPNWANLGSGSRKMMARNACQIEDMDDGQCVDLVLCATEDGASSLGQITEKTGGTGQALRHALSKGIDVINLGNPAICGEYDKYIEERAKHWMNVAGIDVLGVTERAYHNYHAGGNTHSGDVIDFCEQGRAEVLVHVANLKHSFGSGFAKSLKERHPSAYEADLQTPKDSFAKLGTYSQATVRMPCGHEFTIVNLYAQTKLDRNPEECCLDYKAMKKGLNAIGKEFAGKRVAYPALGSGLAGGNWLHIARLLRKSFQELPSHILCRVD